MIAGERIRDLCTTMATVAVDLMLVFARKLTSDSETEKNARNKTNTKPKPTTNPNHNTTIDKAAKRKETE